MVPQLKVKMGDSIHEKSDSTETDDSGYNLANSGHYGPPTFFISFLLGKV
jgi:hypothetical protein